MITFPVLLFTGVGGLFYLVQLLEEHFVPSASYWLAVVCYALLKLAYYGLVAIFFMGFFSLLTGKQLPIYRLKRLRHHLRL
ncbi:glycerophosphoryl diester phosphodiesterase membrane domain-containing protein, partial [Streptococcus suis]